MTTYRNTEVTAEMRIPATDPRFSLREDRTCESCARNKDITDDQGNIIIKGACVASLGMTWQEMSRMEPSVGGCGPSKIKHRPIKEVKLWR